MKLHLATAALLSAASILPTVASANDDGFYNVNYNNIGFELTQVGGYGELIVKPQGFGQMGYGACTVNFTRAADGSVDKMAHVIQSSSATCPEELAFSVSPGAKGMYKIAFSKGGSLTGESFELFPVLRPMADEFKVTSPKGFDILGATVGMTKADLQALMKSEGYSASEGHTQTSEYTNGTVRIQEMWMKGEVTNGRAEDTISVTYTTVPKDDADSALVETLGRKWNIPASANLSAANLKKSLADKHGAVTSQFEARHYDRAGNLKPDAFQPVCADDIHLQTVSSYISFPGSGEEISFSPSCGATVDIMVVESFEVKGLASMLQITLKKADVAYAAFWNSWSKNEAEELKKRYEIQVGMNSTAPKL